MEDKITNSFFQEVDELSQLKAKISECLKKEIDEKLKSYYALALTIEDIELIRFIRARKRDINAAFDQLIANLKWRDEYGYCGFDKKNRPIYWERTGMINVSHILEYVTVEDLKKRHVWHMEYQVERMKTKTKELGSSEAPVTQHTVIMDLNKLSFRMDSRATKLFKDTIDIDQSYYPERLGLLFLINAPWIFKPLWSLISRWIDPHTCEKFHVLGADYAPTLKQFIDEDQIPIEYGGTAEYVVPNVSS